MRFGNEALHFSINSDIFFYYNKIACRGPINMLIITGIIASL